MNLRLALPGGKTLRVKADFPCDGSPVGYRVLLQGKTGIVIGLAEEGQELPLEFPDRSPITTEKHLRAVVDTANHYGLLPWQFLFTLLPSLFDWKEEEYVAPSEKPYRFLDRKSLEVLSWVHTRKKVKEESLKKRFDNRLVEYLIELGFLKRVRQWKVPSLREKVCRLAFPIERALQAIARMKRRQEAQALLYYLFEKRYATREELKTHGFDGELIRSLIKKGVLMESSEEIPHFRIRPEGLRQKSGVALKPLGGKSILMGSWREVLRRLYQELELCVEKRESVLVFCDDLELLKSTYGELYQTLGDRLLLLSSQQSQKEFVKNWFRVGQEEGLVLLGSRVSLLAPFKNLRLVAVLGDRAPRLQDGTDLRHFLFELSRYYGAGFCLATPLPPVSLCLREGWEREVSVPAAEVVVIRRKPEEVLAQDTVRLLKECADEESLILVNKVGYAYAYCRVCGYVLECPKCGSLLTLSRDRGVLFCNSCGYRSPALCPECGRELSQLGFGIEKAMEEVERLRLRSEHMHFGTLPELDRTYEGVFILHADNILSIPWYDSAERYFSYVWQALSISKKRLVIQTVMEHNPLLELLKSKDWEGFCREELGRRKEENLPPFSRLIRIEVNGEPDLSHLPVEVSKRSTGKTLEMLVKVDLKNFSPVIGFLRSLRPISLQVL